MELLKKIEVLADAAKYEQRRAQTQLARLRRLGASTGAGICHSFTPDGRCVSLLKILLTNFRLYDCQYRVNHRSSNAPRACFTPDEVVDKAPGLVPQSHPEGACIT